MTSTFTFADLARMAAMMPKRDYDPFSLGLDSLLRPSRLMGMDVIESPDVPRYVLPAEVCPGVPWPPGFRDEINRWSRSFLGTTNVMQPNTVLVLANKHVVMRPGDIVKFVNCAS